ncbi:MAG: hypothetical protein ABEJ75_03600 [Candidatus Nanohaloarchaea archaeon]
MKIEKLLKQLKREFIKVNLIQASLDSLLFFLSTNLLLFIFSIRLTETFANPPLLAVLTLVFGAGDLAYRAYNYRLEIYEEENPQLREVLRTARDNIDQQNVVSQALFDEVVSRARSVSSESIIPSKRIIQKILLVGGLSFLTVVSGMTDFQITSRDDAVSSLDFLDRFSGGDDNFTLRNSSSIFRDVEQIDYSADINFSIEGEAKAGTSRIPYGSTEEAVFKAAPRGLQEDLALAKRYSLAIKDFS